MKKYVFISIATFVFALTVSVTKFKPNAAPKSETPTVTLEGKAAIQQLKAEGSYSSLAAAYQTARYAVSSPVSNMGKAPVDKTAPYAQNPRQHFNSYFTPEGAHLYVGASRVSLQLTAAGYGEQLTAVGSGEVKTQNNRVEIAHHPAIKEWFVNKPDGLEHGFTLAAPLSDKRDSEMLRLKLSVKGNLVARAVSDGQALSWHDDKGAEVLNYSGLKVTDADGKSLAARMTAERGNVIFEVDDRGANYPVTIDPTFTAHSKLNRPDEEADSFGAAVATNGATIVVGAPQTDAGALNSTGAAYIFAREGSLWAFRQKLLSAGLRANDRFGSSVAMSGSTIVVGTPGFDSSPSVANTGSAYVYAFNNGAWIIQQILVQPSPQAGEGFGQSVAIDGNTVVVGCPVFTNNRGRVAVFTAVGGGWQFRENLNFQPQDGDQFGASVSVSGNTIVAGIPLRDIIFQNTGSVRLFDFNGTTWAFTQEVQALDGEGMDEFGTSVSIRGNKLVVGAIFDSSPGISSHGSAYYFTRPAVGQPWAFQRKFLPTNLVANTTYGNSVALSGSTIVVGTLGAQVAYIYEEVFGQWLEQKLNRPSGSFGWSVAVGGDVVVVGDPDNPTDGDAALVYQRTGFSWAESGRLSASASATNDLFGSSVAMEGNTIVVGASGQSNGTASSGAVYVFTKERGGYWNYQQTLRVNSSVQHPNFGHVVGISSNTIAVGSPESSTGTISALPNVPGDGSVYLFAQVAGRWQLVQTLQNSNQGNFGGTLTIAGGYLAVGARTDIVGANRDQGSVYVYRSTDTGWIFVQRLTSADGLTGDHFGTSVATDGTTLAIGANDHDIGAAANQGAVYIYSRSGTSFGFQQKLISADGALGDWFGLSVGLSGDTLAVGAPRVNIGATADKGAVYVYTRSGSIWLQQGSRLIHAAGGVEDYLGASVAIEGNVLIAGASGGGSNTRTLPCYAAVFSRTNSAWSADSVITSPGTNNNNSFGRALSLKGNSLLIGAAFGNVGLLQSAGSVYSYTAPIIPCAFSITPTSQSFTATGGSGAVNVTTNAACDWTALSNASWITLSNFGGSGNGSVGYAVAANSSGPRSGTITVAGQTFTVTQAGITCTFSLTPATTNFPSNGGVGSGTINTQTGCPWTATSNAAWISITGAGGGTGTGTFNFNVTNNPGANRTGTIAAGGQTLTVNQSGPLGVAGLQFYPLAHPVRLLDTRSGQTGCDAPGAKIPGNTSRTQTAAGRTCDGLTIPANAAALVGNVTTVQSGGGFLTLYPSDITRPLAANSNYSANQILNNVFTVRLGANDGAFKIFVTSDTDLVVDITGYYAAPSASGLYFHPLPKPVRLLETRAGFGGCFTPGAPLQANSTTSQIATTICDGVVIPAGAQALVGNATTVNTQSGGWLTLFPANAARPLAASSNFTAGAVINAPFTVGLSPSGQFNIFTTSVTDLVVDVTGYYSAQMSDSNGQGLLFNALAGPVRLLDTRANQSGCFTPGAQMIAATQYLQPATGVCTGIPANAKGVVGNATTLNAAAPNGFLTFWPSDANQPTVATSNYQNNQVFNRHFTVGLGPDGAFKRFAWKTTDLVIDLSGYFAP
ncbi:MAG: BACON domain-containing protein [Blastocatellia bacterium]